MKFSVKDTFIMWLIRIGTPGWRPTPTNDQALESYRKWRFRLDVAGIWANFFANTAMIVLAVWSALTKDWAQAAFWLALYFVSNRERR